MAESISASKAPLGEAGAGARVEIEALHRNASLHSLGRAAKAVHYAVTQLAGDEAKAAAALLAEIDAMRAKVAA